MHASFTVPAQLPSLEHHVQNHLEVIVDAIVRSPVAGSGNARAVPGEFAVVRIPAVWAKPCSEIDHRVAGQLLLAKRFASAMISSGEPSVRCDCWYPSDQSGGISGKPVMFAYSRKNFRPADSPQSQRHPSEEPPLF